MYAGGVNLTPLFFMNVYRIYIFLVYLSSPFVDELTKKGEKKEFIYACFYIVVYAYKFNLYEPSLNFFIVHCYAGVKGELLLSLSLIHAYITS